MIPILYESNTTDFNNNGIGRLSDAITCIVTEERNGQYELQMTYPLDGALYGDLQVSKIIWATPSDGENEQAFRIYKVSRPISGIVTIYAEHISYQLSCVPVSKYSATSAAAAMSGLTLHAAVNCPFAFWTDLTTSGNFSVDAPAGIRSVLGGTEGSILDVFGGEYKWDNYTVRLYAHRGADNGVTLRYGKNITDLQQEENITNTVTGVYPYWQDSDGNYVELTQKVVLSENAGNFPYPRVAVVDCSQEFEQQPTQQQLLDWANDYIGKAGIGVPAVSIVVSFVALWQTEQYKDIAPLERVKLCDTVTVEYEKLGVSAKAKVISTEYDVLAERYNSIGIGDTRSSLTTQIVDQQKQINDKPSKGYMDNAISNATNWITGGIGGYVIFHRNADGQPDEILIMDTPNIETAQNVWRWNQGGFGHSSSGYDGPYTTAITQDGAIVADFITVGTMLANIIKGGTLTLGGDENGNGVCQVLDANGNIVVKLDVNGITATQGSFEGTVKAKSGVVGPWSFTETSFICLNTESGGYAIQITKQPNGTYSLISRGAIDIQGSAAFENGINVSGGKSWFYGNVEVQGELHCTDGFTGSFVAGSTRINVDGGIITGIE